MKHLTIFAVAMLLTACSSSSDKKPAAPVSLTGTVSDSPVIAGTLRVQSAAEVARAGDATLATLTRDPADGDRYTLSVPGSAAGQIVFIFFDAAGATDMTFGDTPPNLASVALLATAGSQQRLNVTPHTAMIAQQVLAQLDPDGDGILVDNATLLTALAAAELNVLAAAGTDTLGRALFPGAASPFDLDDVDALHAASDVIGLQLRGIAVTLGISLDDALAALAADAADGDIDGTIPPGFDAGGELVATAAAADEFTSREDDADYAAFAMGPCSTAAVSLRRACGADIVDDQLEGTAKCGDTSDAQVEAGCLAALAIEINDTADECEEVFDARLALCESLGDAAHEPAFGTDFAADFVDPMLIGDSITPNPWFPLVAGNTWVYADDAETVTVTVTDEVRLIDGVPCLTVTDIVTEDGELIEDTDDWYAQDTDGNVWYCGEIAQNFEDGELTDVDGSWKAGRDGAKAGILLPFAPEIGAIFRQEVDYGNAEDVIEIESLTDSESAPAGSCDGNCLRTRDFTPLEADANENKYYAPGIGLIVEVDLTGGGRLELQEFSVQ